MTEDLELFLPYPPTINNYYVKSKTHVRISEKGRKFRDLTQAEIVKLIPPGTTLSDIGIEPPYGMIVVAFPPDNRKRDIDNILKPILDAITKTGIWSDDSTVNHLIVYRGKAAPPSGNIYIRIFPAGPIIPNKGFDYSLL